MIITGGLLKSAIILPWQIRGVPKSGFKELDGSGQTAVLKIYLFLYLKIVFKNF
jgi:hypothetical protein